jgi:hypothetical protein
MAVAPEITEMGQNGNGTGDNRDWAKWQWQWRHRIGHRHVELQAVDRRSERGLDRIRWDEGEGGWGWGGGGGPRGKNLNKPEMAKTPCHPW